MYYANAGRTDTQRNQDTPDVDSASYRTHVNASIIKNFLVKKISLLECNDLGRWVVTKVSEEHTASIFRR